MKCEELLKELSTASLLTVLTEIEQLFRRKQPNLSYLLSIEFSDYDIKEDLEALTKALFDLSLIANKTIDKLYATKCGIDEARKDLNNG